MWVAAVLLLGVFVCWAFLDTRKPKQFPPGPAWLPLLGNLLVLKKLVKETRFHHLAWARLAARYGPVVGVRMGRSPPLVLLSGREAIAEALNNDACIGRPDGIVSRTRTMGKRRGVLTMDGEEWKEQRRFLLRNLRDFGFGKRSMEALILDEAKALVDKLLSQAQLNKAEGVRVDNVFTVPVINSLWTLIAGVRFPDDHPTLVNFVKMNDAFVRSVDATGGLVSALPALRYVAPQAVGFTDLLRINTTIWTFLSEFVWEHKKTLSDEYSRDLIDVYLREIADKKVGQANVTEMTLVAVMRDLFGAGTETSSNTLSFAVLHMLLHTRVQHQVQQEIDHVIGRDRPPCLADRAKTPYLNAVIMEVQRKCNVLPLSVPHRAMRDTQLLGYHIPKDSTIVTSLYSLHMDAEFWGDPAEFRPERFLDAEGQLKNMDQMFMPFGTGKRRCLGENMARDTLFLFFASMLQQLSFAVPNPDQPPSCVGVNGFTLSTGPYHALVTVRE